jgi:catalase
MLSGPPLLIRLVILGALVLGIAGTFAWVAGWFSPGSLTQRRFVDGFEEVNGLFPGFRRNHAKGMCISGDFESNGQGERLSKARVFRPGHVPVSGRF